MKMQKITVTPAMATQWLSAAATNRKLSNVKVCQLASLMGSQSWKLTHQGILLGEGNCVLDGQHRLTAIIRYGRSVEMWVCFAPELGTTAIGIPVDKGDPRSASDSTGYPSCVTTVASLLFQLCRDRGRKSAPKHHSSSVDYPVFCQRVMAALGAAVQRTSRATSQAPIKAAVATLVLEHAGTAQADTILSHFVASTTTMHLLGLPPSIGALTARLLTKKNLPSWFVSAASSGKGQSVLYRVALYSFAPGNWHSQAFPRENSVPDLDAAAARARKAFDPAPTTTLF